MQSMNEIHHSERAHAMLGASSSHRWLMCPPSVRLSEHFENDRGPEEGLYFTG